MASSVSFALGWLAQGAAMGLIAILVARLFGRRHQEWLTWWWRYVALWVVVGPLIPLLSPRRMPTVAGPVATFVDQAAAAIAPAAPTGVVVPVLAWLVGAWALGVVARGGWLWMGHRRLQRLIAQGSPVVDDPALDRAHTLAASVPTPLAIRDLQVLAVEGLGPCAVGFLRVRILIPRDALALPDDQRTAIYLHELLHVRRLDVGRAYLDEAWRTLWWWQPAVSWALARLRLTQEIQVDRLVVSLTRARRAYGEALMWCGQHRAGEGLGLAVIGTRHTLLTRVTRLGEEEARMSRVRSAGVSLAAGLCFAIASAVVASSAPLRLDLQGQGLPPVAEFQDAGPFERQAVLPTLDLPAPRRIAAVAPVWTDDRTGYLLRTHLVLDASGTVVEARVVGAPPADRLSAMPNLAAAIDAVLAAVRQWQFDAPPQAPMLIATDVAVGTPRRMLRTSAPSRSSAAPPLRVGGNIGPPEKLVDVKPVYPQVAIDAKVTGVVIIEATIDAEGAVSDARVVRSIPLLDAAALDAVRQWRYTPTLVNGAPTPVTMTMTVNFTLQ